MLEESKSGIESSHGSPLSNSTEHRLGDLTSNTGPDSRRLLSSNSIEQRPGDSRLDTNSNSHGSLPSNSNKQQPIDPKFDIDPNSHESPSPLNENERNVDGDHNVQQQSFDFDAVEAKTVLKKIDRRLMPLLFLIYLLQYLDKNSLNFASAFGLQEGTQLQGQDFSWLGSIFYFGYLVAQYPAGYAMQRWPIGKFLSIITIIWGAILMTTPACVNFAGIATNRFILGLFEASINPGFILIMGLYYTTAEQPLRLETYYCTNGIATMFGGLIGYAVGHITSGLPQWMYVFIIFGSISITLGIIALVLLPDLPSTAKFLTERERAVAVHRVAANKQGIKNRHFKVYQAWQTLRDPKTWLLFVMAVGAQVPNSALTSFTSIIIGSFGFDTLGTQYLQIPGGAVQALSLFFGGVLATKYATKGHTRSWIMIGANLICILGAGLLVGLPPSNKWGRLVAIWLCYFQGVGFSLSLTIVSSNIAGTTKKQLTAAAVFTGYCIGNIIGPQTFKDDEKPGYHSAYVAMLVGYVIKLIAIVSLYVYMWSVNKKRDHEAATSLGADGIEVEKTAKSKVSNDERIAIEKGMMDVTELDNPGFRYVL